MMKYTLSTYIVILVFMLACTGSGPLKQEEIIGTWKIDTIMVADTPDTQLGRSVLGTLRTIFMQEENRIQFTEDSTMKFLIRSDEVVDSALYYIDETGTYITIQQDEMWALHIIRKNEQIILTDDKGAKLILKNAEK